MSGPRGEGPLPATPGNVSVRFNSTEADAAVLRDVDRWAEKEHRNRSQMIRVLLIEALSERQRIDKDKS